MSDNVNLDFLGAHITRLRADITDTQSKLARLNSDGASVVSNVTELSLKIAHIERSMNDIKSYVDRRTIELFQYGLHTVKEELTTAARQRGRAGS